MNSPMELAGSHWPRTGRDLRNSALAPFPGPINGEIVLEAQLPLQGALVVADDGNFLVAGEKQVIACTPGGEVLWRKRLEEEPCAPLALSGGRILVNAYRYSYLLDSSGQTLQQWKFPKYGVEDSGRSPTLTQSGRPLFSGIEGQVWIARGTVLEQIGNFGYDVLPPAVLPSGELAIAGYCGTGPCLVNDQGTTLWARYDFDEADELVTANRSSEITFGNLNKRCSIVVKQDGAELFRLPYPAVFSEHPDGWVAVSKGKVRCLDRSGGEKWSALVDTRRKFGMEQASCDSTGNVYVPITGGLAAFDRDGNQLFATNINKAQPENLALLPGRVAMVCGSRLVVVR